MKTIINVECIDQELVITNSPVIASGGVHENFIAFNFCEKWDGFGKTAVFYINEKERFYSVLDSDDVCEVPHEVTDHEGTMHFGVYGESGEVTRTSKVVKYKISKGAMTTLLKPSEEPTPDIYQQLLSAYGQTNEALAMEKTEREAAINALNSAILAEESARKQAHATEKAERQAEIAVERERINQFTSLKEGSTTGDAELIDGHVDYTGKLWDNIGEHIRGVSGQLSSEIDNVESELTDSTDLLNITNLVNFLNGSDNVGSKTFPINSKVTKHTFSLSNAISDVAWWIPISTKIEEEYTFRTVFSGSNLNLVNVRLYSSDKVEVQRIENDKEYKLKANATLYYARIFVSSGQSIEVSSFCISATSNTIDKLKDSILSETERATEKETELKDSIDKLSFDCEKYGLPVIKLNGNIDGMNKDNKKTLNYIYNGMKGTCTLKLQGASSIGYPKKNYTINFDKDFEAKQGWGSQSKYVLKADWVDFSHLRNVVSADLWYQITKDREKKLPLSELTDENNNILCTEDLSDISCLHSELLGSPHGGAIDGFPIKLMINEEYQGIYNFNIPKDSWAFNMTGKNDECILCAEYAPMRATTTIEEIENENTFSLEYSSDSMTEEKVVNSLNTLIQSVINGKTSGNIESVKQYIDFNSVTDYFIFTILTGNIDGIYRNYLLSTYDGNYWHMGAYDLDCVFGNGSDGTGLFDIDTISDVVQVKNNNDLLYLPYKYDRENFVNRYNELRKGILSESNVMKMFYRYCSKIPKALYDEEIKIWTNIPYTSTSNVQQIVEWYRLRCQVIDMEISSLAIN